MVKSAFKAYATQIYEESAKRALVDLNVDEILVLKIA